MKKKTIEKIIEIFNKYHDILKVYWVPDLTDSKRSWLSLYEDGRGKAEYSYGYVNDESIHGFLISREYQFAEAWAEMEIRKGYKKSKHDLAYYTKLVDPVTELAKKFIQELALAVDKNEWLEENL